MVKRLSMVLAGLILSTGMALAQKEVSGTVVSESDGEPVIGASILVEGTSTGTVTDVDGNFRLTLPEGKNKLRVQYIGMSTETVVAQDRMKITLKDNSKDLDEVIVTGYGTFKKSSFTGAASTLSTTALKDVPASSLEDKLAGGVPGVSVSSSSGAPGAMNTIRVRGMGSINAGNEPLYVIDGTPVQSGNINGFSDPSTGDGYNSAGTNILSTLNSNDIESITVIKDAAAASLYGSRAANGVIVITTKGGKKGKTQVNFRSDWGFSNMAIDYRPMKGGAERRELLYEGYKNYSIYTLGLTEAEAKDRAESIVNRYAPEPDPNSKLDHYTDWKDLLFKTGSHQNYEASVSGGSDNTQFYTSLSYMNQEGILENQGLERFTGNANISHTFGRFKMDVTSLFSKMRQNIANEGTSFSGAVANYAFFMNPSIPAYNADGSYNRRGSNITGVNPLNEYAHVKDENLVKRAYNTIKLDYNIWDNLHLVQKIAYDYVHSSEDVLWDKYSNDGSSSNGLLQRAVNDVDQLNAQTQLFYNKTFGKHTVDALVGFEVEDCKQAFDYEHGSDYPGELYEFSNAGNTSAQSQKDGYRMESFLGRVNYNYEGKYYAGVSLRTDGSSRLARENRWGTFWSLSGSWRFTAEKFMEPYKNWLSDGKLRLSYGVNGTQPKNYYDYMKLYSYNIKYDGQAGMAVLHSENKDLRWEKNKAFNVGLDLTFIDRIAVTFDYYVRNTSDLILDRRISYVPGVYNGSGNAALPQNVGSMRNSGFELNVTSTNIQKKDFSWTTTLNLAHNSNKVTKLNDGTNAITSSLTTHQVGQPYWSYFTYEYAGADPETGKECYYINDGTENSRKTTTDLTKAHRVITGKHDPDVEGGLTNNLKWKFIDFGLTLTYSFGGKAYDAATWQETNGGSYLYAGAVPDYYDLGSMWKKPGDHASQPMFSFGSTSVISSRWLMPTDHVRVKNMTLGFTAPTLFVKKLGLSRARAYVSASNLLTFKSKDLRVDPETPVNGICTFETPALRTVTFGIDLGF